MGKEGQTDYSKDSQEAPFEPTGDFAADYVGYCNQHHVFPIAVRSIPSVQRRVDPALDGDEDAKPVESHITVSTKERFLMPEILLLSDEESQPITVRIAGWTLNVPTMQVLLQTMVASDNISTLDFWNVGFNDESASILGKAVQTLQLQQLSITNNIAPSGSKLSGQALANLLAPVAESDLDDDDRRCSLLSLTIRRCSLDDEELSPIIKTLMSNQRLVHLNLSGNRISSKGAGELSEILRKNRSLRSLNLADNSIEDAGIELLAASLMASELRHEEIVRRRKLLSSHYSEEVTPTNRSAQGASTPGTKAKGKGDKKERKRSGKGTRSKSKSPNKGAASNVEASVVNPLIECVVEDAEGKLILNGNFELAHLNLAGNLISASGMDVLQDLMEYQRINSDGAGIQRLVVNGNPSQDIHHLEKDLILAAT